MIKVLPIHVLETYSAFDFFKEFDGYELEHIQRVMREFANSEIEHKKLEINSLKDEIYELKHKLNSAKGFNEKW